jgi:hypothetical protein
MVQKRFGAERTISGRVPERVGSSKITRTEDHANPGALLKLLCDKQLTPIAALMPSAATH